MLKMATHVGAHVVKGRRRREPAPHKIIQRRGAKEGAVAALVHENAEAKEPISEQHRPQDPHQRMGIGRHHHEKGKHLQPLGGH